MERNLIYIYRQWNGNLTLMFNVLLIGKAISFHGFQWFLDVSHGRWAETLIGTASHWTSSGWTWIHGTCGMEWNPKEGRSAIQNIRSPYFTGIFGITPKNQGFVTEIPPKNWAPTCHSTEEHTHGKRYFTWDPKHFPLPEVETMLDSLNRNLDLGWGHGSSRSRLHMPWNVLTQEWYECEPMNPGVNPVE